MKKLILSKTMLFIFILVFINLFIAGFGSENTLIGVTVITAMLMLLERDLTVSPIKNTFKFISINIVLGLLAFISVQSIVLGLFCNFIALFLVGYIFSYDLRSPLYVAFGLQYLFMVSTPVTLEELPMRMTSLIFGGIAIMIAQLIVNKNKLEKASNKILINICDDILQKAQVIKNNDFDTNDLDIRIDISLKKLKKILYDNRKEDFFITPKGISTLNIILNFERISILLNEYKYNKNKYRNNSLSKMCIELENLKLYISNDSVKKSSSYQKFNSINLCEFYDSIENIYTNFYSYRKSDIERNLEEKLSVPDEFKKISVYKRNFNLNSARFTYAFKVGLGIAIAGFIKDYFNLSEGRWILFTVFAIIQPYSEISISKSKKRILGTIIGCFIVFILFSIFKEKSIRGIIIISAGYISSYTKDYRDLMICNTISAIGAVCTFGQPHLFILNRFLFVILGVGIALAINKLILPYNAKKGYASLIDMYRNVVSEMALEIRLCIKKQSNLHKVKNLMLISTLIEDKILSMQDLVKDSNYHNLLTNKKLMMCNMYSLYLKLKSLNDPENIESIIYESENLASLEEAKDLIIDNINSSTDKDDVIIYKNLLYILENKENNKSYA